MSRGLQSGVAPMLCPASAEHCFTLYRQLAVDVQTPFRGQILCAYRHTGTSKGQTVESQLPVFVRKTAPQHALVQLNESVRACKPGRSAVHMRIFIDLCTPVVMETLL